ncbi:pas domain s-box family protein [Stylonychia lemnae]|uniref:Pas domain s-box family protein n=1 Tax=Stylonychia lemnae TaxID=5949 RepID=A0A078ADQ6_STYLE|nr:pas domain s-box family protein [Stylonychia lemnae]|eukprot:CDW79028.1 pas domain s-box family protein [Stylonychia lemnae]
MMNLDKKGFSIVFILSVITICSSVNIINIRQEEKLIVDVLNNEITDTYQLEKAIYLMLDLIFRKSNNHLTNEYDGLIHAFEMNEDLYAFGKNGYKKSHMQTQIINLQPMAYTSRLEQFYHDHIQSQLEYLNKKPEEELQNSDDPKKDIYNQKNQASMYFGNTTLNMLIDNTIPIIGINSANEISNTIVQETINHTLAESFNYESLNKQRLNELDQERSSGRNMIDKIRDKENKLKQEKIQFLADNLLVPFLRENPDNIQLMFLKCYLSLIHLKNRFICLTVITAIENLNQDQRYLDQIENKISQQYFLEICLAEQAKANDQMDSNYFLDFNLRINDYYDLLLSGSKLINQFWSLLNSQNSYKQILKLEKLSLKISEILRQVKQSISKIEQETPLMQVSEQVLFYTATFYQMALRDMYLSDYYFKQITQNRSLMAVQNIKGSFSNFDEISLAIVDGNFSNMGRLLYANKILLRHLGYKQEQVLQQTVHLLMPREIALVHDKFWNRFRDTGIPSILEQQRILFIKDRNGYAHPFNIFIKFIYHQKYGYTFLGIFKKQNKMIMTEIESPIRLSQIFFFITNYQGKITEISKSCEKLIGLNQQIFEHLSAFLEEGLHPHHFNPNLSISQLDFSKSPCVLINKAIIETSIVFRHTKELEFELDQETRSRVKSKIQVQIKIIKETYGQSDVTVYYFLFAVIKDPVMQTVKEGIFDKLFHKNHVNDEGFDSQDQYNKFTESMATRSLMSMNQNMNSQSISSCSMSAVSNGFDELKYLEDNIDYTKTPQSLLIVKLIFNTIILMIIALTAALLVLNQVQISQSISQISVVKVANQNMVLLSELSILTRNYININDGLEPGNSSYFSDRKKTVLQQSLDIIEEMRINQKLLEFKDKIKNNDGEQNSTIINSKNNNGQKLQQKLSFNYALNQYLVKCFDLYGFPSFQSKELSYLSKSTDATGIYDSTVYYIITNQNGDLRTMTQESALTQGQDINDKNIKFIEVNRIFMIVASCCILIGVIAALYFYSKIIDNQSKTLAFFSELEKDLIEFCIQGSLGFFQFLSNDNEEIIILDSEIINQRKNIRIKQLEQKLAEIQEQQRQKAILSNSTNPNALETSDVQLMQKKGREETKINLEEIKDEEDDQPTKYKKQMEKVFNTSVYSKAATQQVRTLNPHKSTHNLAEILQNQKTAAKNKFRELDKQIKKIDNDGDSHSNVSEKGKKYRIESDLKASTKTIKINSDDQTLNVFTVNNSQTDLKQIFMHWKFKKMAVYSVFFLTISAIFVSYFLIQYIIVEKVHVKMKDHTQHLSQLYQGQTCMNWFVSDLRETQIRNYSSFNPRSSDMYNECTQQAANFNLWLGSQTDNDEIISLNKKLSAENKICEIIFAEYQISKQNCQNIYQGIFQKSLYQVQIVFLHDTLQSQIQFTSNRGRDEKFLNQSMRDPIIIDMIDGKQQYLSKITTIVANTVHDALSADEKALHIQQLYVFGVYIFALIATLLILNCFVFVQMRKSIWNSKIIFKLLPIDELDISFKKRIQMFLFKP